LKLAQMKSELAAKERKLVDYDEDLVNTDLKEVSFDYDIIKMEAVDASGLGKKEDNIKVLTNLKLKKTNCRVIGLRSMRTRMPPNGRFRI